MAEEEKKSEAEVLFPEIEVDGLRLRPWSFGQLADLTPVFKRVARGMSQEGIKVEQLDQKPVEFAVILLPDGPEIIARTTGISLEEVRSWEPAKALPVLMTIISQNLGHLKNSLGPVLAMLSKMAKSA